MPKLPRFLRRAYVASFGAYVIFLPITANQIPAIPTVGVIEGSVTNHGGAPIPWAQYQACTWDGALCTSVREDSVDESGAFSIELPVGIYRMAFRDTNNRYESEYYPDAALPAQAGDLVVTGYAPTVVNVVLEDAAPSYVVRGRVTNVDGNGIEGVRASICEGIGNYCDNSASTNGAGYYEKTLTMPGLYSAMFFHPDGSYYFEHFPGGDNRATTTYFALRAGVPLDNIDVQLDKTPQFTGSFYDASSGRPVTTQMEAEFCFMSGDTCVNYYHASTNGGNTYHLGGVPPGNYRIHYYDYQGRYEAQFFNNKLTAQEADIVTIGAGEIHTAVVQLGKRSGVKGTVSDMQGNRLGGIKVDMTPVNCVGSCPSGWGTVTGDGGNWAFPNVSSHDYILRFGIDHPDYINEWYADALTPQDATVLHIRAGQPVQVIHAQLERKGTISGRLVNTAGNGAGDVSVDLCTINLNICSSAAKVFTDAQGYYTLPSVNPGVWYVLFAAMSGGEYPSGYREEFYDNARFIAEATAITVGVGQNVTNINAELLRPVEVE